MTLRVECPLCGRDLGTVDGGGVHGVTHRICQDCAPAYREKVKRACDEMDEEMKVAKALRDAFLPEED